MVERLFRNTVTDCDKGKEILEFRLIDVWEGLRFTLHPLCDFALLLVWERGERAAREGGGSCTVGIDEGSLGGGGLRLSLAGITDLLD